jgi:plastocyanin
MEKARVLIVGALVALAACGGGGGGDGGGGTGPAVFTTMSIAPTSVGLLVGGTQALTATARDQNNNTLGGLTTTFASGNSSIATVTGAGVVTAVAVGATQITVTGTIGSVTKTAQINVQVSVPGATASVDATLSNTFTPATAFVSVGGIVTWTFATQHNVTFEGSGAPANVPTTGSGSVSRTFPTAGTFQYQCTIHPGMSGSVVVQ